MKRCRCGHDRHHHMVTAEGRYGFLGWMLIIVGATPTPKLIQYKCRVCDQVFDETDDEKTRRGLR